MQNRTTKDDERSSKDHRLDPSYRDDYIIYFFYPIRHRGTGYFVRIRSVTGRNKHVQRLRGLIAMKYRRRSNMIAGPLIFVAPEFIIGIKRIH